MYVMTNKHKCWSEWVYLRQCRSHILLLINTGGKVYLVIHLLIPWPRFNLHLSGCIGPHSDSILICFELPPLLPPRWFPSLTSPCWLCSSSLYADDLNLLNPGTSQCNACGGMHWWSIRITCPSQRSLLSLSMSSILCCPVLTLTSSFVTLSFQEMPKMLLFH